MTRRKWLSGLVCGMVAMTLLVGPALAEELKGLLTAVDAGASKVTVQAENGDDVEVTVTDETTYETPKGKNPIDLAKVSRALDKAKEKGRKGIGVIVTHEKGIASNIKIAGKKASGTD